MKRTWIAPAIVSAAVVGTAALSVAAASPLTSARATVLSGKTVVTPAAKPGWQVVAKVGSGGGPAGDGITGSVSAQGAKSAWAVWTGKGPSYLDRWTGTKWVQVKVPVKL